MAIVAEKHLEISAVEDGAGGAALNANFRELANRTGLVIRQQDNVFTAYHPSADTDAARGSVLAEAVAAASSGDTIFLRGGTFAHSAAIAIPSGVCIRGAGRNTVITRAGEVFTISGGSGIEISDLSLSGRVTVDGGNTLKFKDIAWTANGQSVRLHMDDAGGTVALYDIRVQDCEFTGSGQAIYAEFASRMFITGNLFWNSTGTAAVQFNQGGTQQVSGFTETSSGHIVDGNHFRNASGWGLQAYGVHDPLFSNNTFEDCNGGGINVIGPIQGVVANNTLERNTDTAGTDSGDGVGIRVEIIDADALQNMDASAQLIVEGNSLSFHSKHIQVVGSHNQHANIQIQGNKCYRSTTETGAAAIDITGYRAQYVIIAQGNEIHCANDGLEGVGIAAAASSATSGRNLILKDNTILEQVDGITLNNLTDVRILGNVLQDCTDAIELNGSSTADAHFNFFDGNTNDANEVSGTLTQSNNVGYT